MRWVRFVDSLLLLMICHDTMHDALCGTNDERRTTNASAVDLRLIDLSQHKNPDRLLCAASRDFVLYLILA
ncbi:MAG: hypothetical protein ABI901_16270 [Roseiflexaceae bacterium]